jgi:hypothetical protein
VTGTTMARIKQDIRSQASSLDNHIPTIKQRLSKFKSNESKGYTFVVLILANKEL